MMLCKKACSLLTAADEGALVGAEKAFFDLHLTICGPCKRYRAQLRATVSALHALPKEDAPADLVDTLAALVEKKM